MIPQDAPRENAQTAAEVTRDTEAPAGAGGGREDLRALLPQIRRAISDPGAVTPRETDESVSNWSARAVIAAVIQPELDRCDAEIAELQEAAAIAHDIATDRRCLAREAVHRAETAEAEASRWRDQSAKGGRLITRLRRENARLRIAWGSARIGRARARQQRDEVAKGRDRAQLRVRTEVDQCMAVEDERDQLKAAVAALLTAQGRMLDGWAEASPERQRELWRNLHEAADVVRAVLDQGHDDLPAVREFVASLDPRERTCTCHPAKKPAYTCRVHGWAATRDEPGEPPCPTT